MGIQKYCKILNKNTSTNFHSALLVIWPLTMLKRTHFSKLSTSRFTAHKRRTFSYIFTMTPITHLMIISQPELGLPVVSLALKRRWGRCEKREFKMPLPLGLLFAFSPTGLPDDPACFAFFLFTRNTTGILGWNVNGETAWNDSVLMEGFFLRFLVLNAASMFALPCFLR